MAEENVDIFEDFQDQEFANSQEYFDYLKQQSDDHNARKNMTDDEKDLLKGIGNIGINLLNTPSIFFNAPQDLLNIGSSYFSDKEMVDLPRAPMIPNFKLSTKARQEMSFIADVASDLVLFPKAIIKLAATSPKIFKAMAEVYPVTFGSLQRTFTNPKLTDVGKLEKIKLMFSDPKGRADLARNLKYHAGAGYIAMSAYAEEPKNKPKPEKMPAEGADVLVQPSNLEDDSPPNVRGKEKYPVSDLAYGGEPEQEDMFTESVVEEQSDIPTINSDIPDDIFQAAKDEGYEEFDVALNPKLLGKVPMWAVAGVDKFKMLLQKFSKNEIKNMDNVKNKLGTKEEILSEAVEDIDIIDTPSGETVVGAIKNKKTIIDSPEDAESVFYSGLEARLMDPNTPKSFENKDQLYNFLNQKGISKVEVEDNILDRYLDVATKNNTPILVDDMLEIVRQAPMRKVQSITYGDELYGGTKRPVYANQYYESGSIPGSYREEVLYLSPDDIPLDPGTLPMSGHDFSEKYVIGWSRLTDRKATLPVDKTKAGITEAIDEKQIKTIQKNQKKLTSQIDGLYASAYEKLKRAGNIEDLPDIDTLTTSNIKDKVNQFTFDLQDMDEPLYRQIEQFENKLMTDNMKLDKFKQMKEGQQVKVTFADEIQSDILQQAKKMEEKFLKQLADLMDKNKATRANTIEAAQRGYDSDFDGLNPEVAEFFIQNKSVFRPIFNTAEDMQQFLNEFTKTQQAISALGDAGLRPDPSVMQAAQVARKKQDELLESLKTSLSEDSMKKLMPNIPFKNRSEWGSALIKMNIQNAAKRKFVDKKEDAAEWFAISPAKLINERYWKGQNYGGTNTPLAERTKDMRGIGMEEFYGGPNSLSVTIDKSGTAATNPNFGKPKHYTSTLEKELKRLAKENNSEFKTIKIDGVGDAFAIKLTPEMLLPHKTHRNKGGMVYTPELIDIFEAA